MPAAASRLTLIMDPAVDASATVSTTACAEAGGDAATSAASIASPDVTDAWWMDYQILSQPCRSAHRIARAVLQVMYVVMIPITIAAKSL